jgi:hypothetical protein
MHDAQSQRTWKERNPEKIEKYHKDYRKKNADMIRESNKKWRKAHPEKVKEWHNTYAKKHPERVKEINRKSYFKHREERIAHIKEYNKNNPEKVAESQKKWRDKNPEKLREYWLRYVERHPERVAAKRFTKHCWGVRCICGYEIKMTNYSVARRKKGSIKCPGCEKYVSRKEVSDPIKIKRLTS